MTYATVTGVDVAIGYTNSIETMWAELMNYVIDSTFNTTNKSDITARPFLDSLMSPVGLGENAGAFPAYSSVYLNFKNKTGIDMVGATDFDIVTVSIPARKWTQDSFETGQQVTLTERDFRRQGAASGNLGTVTSSDVLYAARPNYYMYKIPELQTLRLGAASASAVNKNNSTVFFLLEVEESS